MVHYEYEFLANAKELKALPGVHQAQDTPGGYLLNVTLPQEFYRNPLTQEVRGQDYKQWLGEYGIPGFTYAWDLVSVAGPVIAGPVGIITGIFDKRYIKDSIQSYYEGICNEGAQLATIGHQIAEGMPQPSVGGRGGGGGGDEEEFGHLPYQLSVNYNFEGAGNSYNIEANESNFGILYDRTRGGGRMTQTPRRGEYSHHVTIDGSNDEGRILDMHGSFEGDLTVVNAKKLNKYESDPKKPA